MEQPKVGLHKFGLCRRFWSLRKGRVHKMVLPVLVWGSLLSLMKEIYSNATKVIVCLARPPNPKGLQRFLELVFGNLRDERVAVKIIH